jgi:sterol 3beta-glucosyltransferase
MGIGVALRKFTVDKLANALTLLTTDERMQDRAKLLGRKIRKENGVETAIRYIYRDMEYAQSRITKLREEINASSAWMFSGYRSNRTSNSDT